MEDNKLMIVDSQTLIAKAIDKDVPVETMERLLAMRTQLKEEYAKEQFFLALAKLQSKMPEIKKTKPVYKKNSKEVMYYYAPIESIIKQVKTYIEQNGFSYQFKPIKDKESKNLIMTCIVNHALGHSESTGIEIPIDNGYMTDIQKTGSTNTYGKRYSFCNAFGIMTGDEDDDGAAKVVPPKKKEPTLYDNIVELTKGQTEKEKTQYFQELVLEANGGESHTIQKVSDLTGDLKNKVVEIVEKRLFETRK